MHLQAKRGQPRREERHNSLKVWPEASAAHLLECQSLRELRKKRGLETLKDGEVFFSAQLASSVKELFELESPSAPTPDEPELRPGRAVKRHRSPAVMDTAYLPSAAAKLIGVCPARAVRKRVLGADSTDEAICFNVPLGGPRAVLIAYQAAQCPKNPDRASEACARAIAPWRTAQTIDTTHRSRCRKYMFA
ncbi:hypothetical protein ERJ75_001581600 [Trypanosoma vivax]|nr:hypothetical protein TRVL_09483 [Trypanosoma vivax]KAH8605543.1 hypothetical protein ERJ75_001581600 [Trypanosoma vivax]